MASPSDNIRMARVRAGVAPKDVARSVDLAEASEARIATEHLTIDAYGDRIGWNVAPILANPERVWEYPLVMLQALCDDLRVDWHAFVDNVPPPR
jgi:hypothetical protein